MRGVDALLPGSVGGQRALPVPSAPNNPYVKVAYF